MCNPGLNLTREPVVVPTGLVPQLSNHFVGQPQQRPWSRVAVDPAHRAVLGAKAMRVLAAHVCISFGIFGNGAQANHEVFLPS